MKLSEKALETLCELVKSEIMKTKSTKTDTKEETWKKENGSQLQK